MPDSTKNETDNKIFLVIIFGDGKKNVKNCQILNESMGSPKREKQMETLSTPLNSASNCVLNIETPQMTPSVSQPGKNAKTL